MKESTKYLLDVFEDSCIALGQMKSNVANGFIADERKALSPLYDKVNTYRKTLEKLLEDE